MKYTIFIAKKAEEDLGKIFEYLAYKVMAGENAVRQLNRIQTAIESLDEMPLRNRVYDKEPWKTRNLRIMPVDNYLVFYLTETEVLKVTILRIMYGGRDITNIFKGKAE
mgnify:FL=1